MTPLHLFEGYGVELEYMLVDRDTLAVSPVTDDLLKEVLGGYGNDFENGIVTWSNELVLHVIELKSSRPEADFEALEEGFTRNITKINSILEKWRVMLMPTAAHPFMNPLSETKLWPHDSNEVYEVYNRIFDCKGHGWSNLQSTHLNLPFSGDTEFAKLHAAIRVLLPILPAIAASSPILDGKPTGFLDTRMNYYKTNQSKIPSITGMVIPEQVFSATDYQSVIYEQIESDLAPYDPDHVLNPIWVNSRGAMARFDRGSVEIRVLDAQECPSADLAIVTLVIETLKSLVAEKFFTFHQQKSFESESLVPILNDTIRDGQKALIEDVEYLSGWGLRGPSSSLNVWQKILDHHLEWGNIAIARRKAQLSIMLDQGTLADRILRALDGVYTSSSLQITFRKLCKCLAQNQMFTP